MAPDSKADNSRNPIAKHGDASHSIQNLDRTPNKIKGPLEAAEYRVANIFDYVNWRGDVPMSVDPFNEVDNLILSSLIYVPFDGIVPGEDSGVSMPISEINKVFWERNSEHSINTSNPAIGFAPFLLKKLAGTARFGNLRACSFANEMDSHDQYQFAAITFLLDDGTCYTAFRGTDDSIPGWREDMNLSFMAMTKGQERAVEYLDKRFSGTNIYIRVGGHSKGGNLAVYSSMYCVPEVQERIKEIWSNDGPGFISTITESDDYKRILPKIKKLIPEESIVGILLNSGARAEVISSTADGVMQHSPYSWKVRKNRLVRARKRSDSSVFIDRTLNNWITSLDPDNRKVFIEVLFDAIESSGASTIGEFTDDPVRAYNAFYKTLKNLPSNRRATMLLVLHRLAESGTNQIIEGFLDRLSSLAQKLNG